MSEILWIIILAELIWIVWLGTRPVKHKFSINDFLEIKKKFEGDTQSYRDEMAQFGFRSLEVEYKQQEYGKDRVKKITLMKD